MLRQEPKVSKVLCQLSLGQKTIFSIQKNQMISMDLVSFHVKPIPFNPKITSAYEVGTGVAYGI